MMQPASADYIVNIDQNNAQQMLIEESTQRLVVADFWADWCEPCKQLMPLLEKLAHEYQGQFLLAKINADEQQMIAQQLRVQSLPTVMLFRDGQPIDGFAGMQPETAIREILDKHLPKPWDTQLQQAQQLIAEEQHSEALALLRQAYADSGERADIGLHMALCFLHTNRLDDAEELLNKTKLADQDALYEQLVAQLHLKREAGESPEIKALEQQLAEQPGDLELKVQLAAQYQEIGKAREALQQLIEVLRKDRDFNNGAARATMLDIFKSLGNKDPLVVEYQRQLFSLLY